ncbi:MAG TPA: hypothetical protein VJN22_05170 [Candidatus Eremiobacteraceae bacterium]|nr:hypothetical protein [Candidatus Eremiobacteraceae bacterium]
MKPNPSDLPRGAVPQRTESRWPASLAVIAALALYVTLPEHFVLGPRWLIPGLELALLVPLSIIAPRRTSDEAPWRRIAAVALIAIINLANVGSLVFLVRFLLTEGPKATGVQLLLSSTEIWLTNILVFALWYWELDRGGPKNRLTASTRGADFLFPQMVTPICSSPGWMPHFVDYFFVAFTNATAFSPTDTMPLTPSAKMLMAVQALTSLLTVALVAARAVNILS